MEPYFLGSIESSWNQDLQSRFSSWKSKVFKFSFTFFKMRFSYASSNTRTVGDVHAQPNYRYHFEKF